MTPPLSVAEVSAGEVLRQIDHVKQYASKHPADTVSFLYDAANGLGETFLSFLKSNGQPGWTSAINPSAGWTPEQLETLEELTPLAAQAGGALEAKNLKFGPQSSLIKPTEEDLSLDDAVESVQKYLYALDEKNRQLASILGPVAMINKVSGGTGDISVGPYPPYLPIAIPIPGNAILVLINAYLEACRLLVSNNFFDIGILRKILSFVLALYDILRGNWRDGILSFMGFFGQSWMIYGMIGKTARWVYNFISPDIQSRLESDIFMASKSMILGSWLWFVSVVSPSFIRTTVNDLIEQSKKPLEEINKELEIVEKSAQQVGSQYGLQVQFPRIPLDKIPSFEDIQNLQAILRQPEFYCLDVIKPKIQMLAEQPAFRIVLEMLSIPYKPMDVAEVCKDIPSSVTDVVKTFVTPTVIQEPQQQGGKKARKTRRKKKQSRRRLRL